MSKIQALKSLEKIQVLLGELGFVLAADGYYKDYGLSSGANVRIAPIFDKGLSIDLQYNLVALAVAGQETITIVTGQPVALDRVPGECRTDVMRMLAELAPDALVPKTESFILTMVCTECKELVSSFLNLKGTVKCLECSGFKI